MEQQLTTIDNFAVSESYITHIKVEEDAAYPSSPPPLESTNKKERVIVVAVRKSGRVRMHKARENQNGTFSIGKTWVLDDLTMIESFTHSIPQTAEEQQNKQRACSTGFLVTIQKPYYWTANTAKEKDFFILSLIKIYKKYTGGRLPELIGFSSSELNQLGAPAGPQDVPQPILPQPNGSRAVSSRVPSQDPPAIRGPPPETSRERRPRQPQKRPSEERQLHSAVYQNWSARGAGSSERVHMPGSFPSTDSIHDPSPHSSQPQLRSKRSESPALHSTGVQQPNFRRLGPSQSTDSFQSGRETQQPQTTSSRRPSNERPGQIGTYPTVLRPGIAGQQHSDDRPVTAVRDVAKSPYSAVDSPYSTSDSPPYAITDSPSYPGQGQTAATQAQTLDFNPRSNERLEERSREQIMPRSVQDTRNGDRRDLSASGRDPSRGARGPPSLNPSEHSAEPFPEETPPTTASSQGVESSPIRSQEVTSHSPTDREDGASTPQDPVLKQPPTLPPETQIEAHRPGLGPMIKKKSTTNVASKFRKAATTYNAFRPGATPVDETKDDKPAGGDGITGVFQAPSLAKGVSQDNVRPSTPKQNLENRPATPNLKKDVPTVQVTSSPPKPSISIVPTNPVTQVPPEITVQRNNEPENPEPPIVDRAPEDRRKKRRSDHSAKYAKALGISPNLVEGRTSEIEEVLNDFGWGEESNNRSTCEELETGIRKELARVEAGSWLGAVDNNDDRVAAINEMMDKVIAECDELDGLLTLYNVELGVG